MKFCALASGSSGNCFYVAEGNDAILIDAGISCKQIVERLERIACSPATLKAIFITHEHSDHIRGVDVLARKLKIPIFATTGTLNRLRLCSQDDLLRPLTTTQIISLGSLAIHAFPKSHGAAEPVSYTIKGTKTISVITDAGYACTEVQKHVSSCDLLCIEANHDEDMLAHGPYSPLLKRLISSDKGHLSNRQTGFCIREHGSTKLKQIILSHLSQTNNTPALALKTVNEIVSARKDFSPSVNVSIREEPTPVFIL